MPPPKKETHEETEGLHVRGGSARTVFCMRESAKEKSARTKRLRSRSGERGIKKRRRKREMVARSNPRRKPPFSRPRQKGSNLCPSKNPRPTCSRRRACLGVFHGGRGVRGLDGKEGRRSDPRAFINGFTGPSAAPEISPCSSEVRGGGHEQGKQWKRQFQKKEVWVNLGSTTSARESLRSGG